ncbi:hypothetical protein OZ411_32850 [Bradyrhizobium sp. Arg237L]|uniref:hypothetical protein n=1 Tax=Bradyrhizobium sp. Arg237L TaxID=3003352 RepID=UPI00249E4815|nr:hypothetical protein [Bradyrhizobium sp. Arg237L]MDI4237604.1 hypothetical protein [Bradyrhizobium sp. Arg237L]
MENLTKLTVSRRLLGTAFELFLRDKDPVAIHCLASVGCEIIEGVARDLSDERLKAKVETSLGRDWRKVVGWALETI